MTLEYFGLTTGNFIKLFILVAFLFFFFRMITLLALFSNDKSRKELKIMFVITEIIAWLALSSWIFFIVPLKRFELAGLVITFSVLNFIVWKNIKDSFSLFLINKIIDPKNSRRLKINFKTYKINEFLPTKISLTYNSEKSENNYSSILKEKIKFSQNKTLKKNTTENIREINQLYATLKDNGFINDNTEICISEKDNKFIISIDSFDETDIEKTNTFLNHIF